MMPLLVNTPDPMVKVRVVTTKEQSTETLKTLHSAGVLHVEESQELKPADKEAIERERRRVSELLTDIKDVLAYIPKRSEKMWRLSTPGPLMKLTAK